MVIDRLIGGFGTRGKVGGGGSSVGVKFFCVDRFSCESDPIRGNVVRITSPTSTVVLMFRLLNWSD